MGVRICSNDDARRAFEEGGMFAPRDDGDRIHELESELLSNSNVMWV